VAVLDVSMPGGGVHAAGEIRRRCPATAIIALSSASDAATRRSMLAAGAGRYLVKGDPGADLLDAIAQANAER
jgi:DNA-binding NarL/FixJ family response regulator